MAEQEQRTFLTVSEFARQAGISRQAVQQRMETSLAEFVKVNEQGKKTIDSNALQLFGVDAVKPKEQATEEESKAQTQGTNTDKLYAALLQTVEILQGQLEMKDRQIDSLLKALDSAQQSAARAQTLHAGDIHRGLLEAHTEPQSAPEQQPERKRGFFNWRKGGKQ